MEKKDLISKLLPRRKNKNTSAWKTVIQFTEREDGNCPTLRGTLSLIKGLFKPNEDVFIVGKVPDSAKDYIDNLKVRNVMRASCFKEAYSLGNAIIVFGECDEKSFSRISELPRIVTFHKIICKLG